MQFSEFNKYPYDKWKIWGLDSKFLINLPDPNGFSSYSDSN